MGTRWLLDIGTRKTGSKARQAFFARELRRVRRARALYPLAGRKGNWHRPLHDELAAGVTTALEAVVAEAAAAGADVAILSYEELCDLPRAAVELVAQRLGGARAVVFLRRQDQFLNSLYNQVHKSHRLPLAEIEAFERGMFEPRADLDYRRLLETWLAALGEGAVQPVLYDKAASNVAQFFAAAGVDVDLEGFPGPTFNRALTPEGLSVLRHVKGMARDEDDLVALVTEARRVLEDQYVDTHRGGELYLLDPEARRRVVGLYAESNEWVRRRFFPGRESLFAPVEDAPWAPPDWSRGREAAEAIVASVRRRGASPGGRPG